MVWVPTIELLKSTIPDAESISNPTEALNNPPVVPEMVGEGLVAFWQYDADCDEDKVIENEFGPLSPAS